MNIDFEAKQKALRAEKQQNGLIYGLLAGLAFSLAAWGYDALLLQGANVAFPWTKVLLGMVLSLPIFGLVGFLTARLDSPLVGFIGWLTAGIVLTWFSTRLPFDGFAPALLRLFDPELGQVASYPFTEIMANRMSVLMIVIVPLATIAGLLEPAIIDSATNGTSLVSRLLPLMICMPILALAGGGVDNMINSPLRGPLVTLNSLIEFALRNESVDAQTAREMHLGSLKAIQSVLQPERRLVISSYDDEVMVVHVRVDFEGRWIDCMVVNSQPSFCEPVELASPNPTPGESVPVGANAPTLESTGAAVVTAAPSITSTPIVMSTPAALSDALTGLPLYAITVTLDFPGHSFTGQMSLDYTNNETVALDRLLFRLLPNGKVAYGNGSLSVSEVQLNGQIVTPHLSLTDTVLEVPLPALLLPGEQTHLDFEFQGIVPLNFGESETSSGFGIYNFSDNVLSLASWYPILAVYDARGWNQNPASNLGDSVFSDMARYEVDLTVAEGVVVAATGSETLNEINQGQQHLHFSSGPARDFFLIASPDFEKVSQQAGAVQVNSYYLAQRETGGQAALETAAAALQVYEKAFGPYPYAELDVVAAPMQGASGVEFPGIILIGASLYTRPNETSFDVTVAHEVAHQWWYNLVGNDVYAEPWLDEALTTYSSALYLERAEGQVYHQGLLEYWQERYNQLQASGRDAAVTQPLSFFESLNNPGVYGGVVYTKGALFFEALRQEIGDEAFFSALEQYSQTYSYRIATGADLLGCFESAAGRSLDEFYTLWLNTP